MSAPSPHRELDERVRRALSAAPERTGGDPPDWVTSAFDAVAGSRHLDLVARRLRETGLGYYTIGSAGHESNALVAAALRPTDPALLHYRSGGFYLARCLQAGRPLADGVRDVLLGMFAAARDPASGGRHKVFGHPELAIIPQTSTIASQLPRAVGVAFAIGRAARAGLGTRWPADALAVTSLGDASLNHSTAVGALNTAGYCAHAGLAVPLLIVCEDNGWGISVPSPAGWVAAAAHRPGIEYFTADGSDPEAVRASATEAAEFVRRHRRPALLHLRCVRYLAHAGTDVESAYRSAASIAADADLDPVVAVGRLLGQEAARRYATIGDLVCQIADQVQDEPRLSTATQVTAALQPRRPDRVAVEAARQAAPGARAAVFGGSLPEAAGPLTLAQSITAALTDQMALRPEMFVFGEDVGRKGGVYGLTRGLQRRFRATRVFDTPLDEQSILGLGLGMGVSGLLPVPEIQYLAYLHNAADQLRGEAASLQFFSNGAYANPMVVRIAGLAYQKGFGGHFHNDNAVAALRDIPGLALAVPARPDDAVALLRTCLAAAVTDGQVSVLLEPIALYHERDAYETGDRGWLAEYPPADVTAPLGSGRTHGDGNDLTIVTFGNGLRMSLRVARRLASDGIGVRVLDLRWLAPLPVTDLLREAAATGRVLVADETRRSGGVSEAVITALADAGYDGRVARVASEDSFVPLGPAADTVLLGEEDIERAARALL